MDIIQYYSKKVGINELNITSDEDDIAKAIDEAYNYVKNDEEKFSALKKYLIDYILLAKAKELEFQGKNKGEIKQLYDEKKKELENKELNDDNKSDWITGINEARKTMQKEINTEKFDTKLCEFESKYGEINCKDVENFFVDEGKIKKEFNNGENRRWLKPFLNLEEENGGFDVYKYLEDTQDLNGAVENLKIKEGDVNISYAYLNPEINKTGICDKDWDEYLANFVPIDILKLLQT